MFPIKPYSFNPFSWNAHISFSSIVVPSVTHFLIAPNQLHHETSQVKYSYLIYKTLLLRHRYWLNNKIHWEGWIDSYLIAFNLSSTWYNLNIDNQYIYSGDFKQKNLCTLKAINQKVVNLKILNIKSRIDFVVNNVILWKGFMLIIPCQRLIKFSMSGNHISIHFSLLPVSTSWLRK